MFPRAHRPLQDNVRVITMMWVPHPRVPHPFRVLCGKGGLTKIGSTTNIRVKTRWGGAPITRSPDHPITRSQQLTHLQKAASHSASALSNRMKRILPGPSARKKARPPDAACHPHRSEAPSLSLNCMKSLKAPASLNAPPLKPSANCWNGRNSSSWNSAWARTLMA